MAQFLHFFKFNMENLMSTIIFNSYNPLIATLSIIMITALIKISTIAYQVMLLLILLHHALKKKFKKIFSKKITSILNKIAKKNKKERTKLKSTP